MTFGILDLIQRVNIVMLMRFVIVSLIWFFEKFIKYMYVACNIVKTISYKLHEYGPGRLPIILNKYLCCFDDALYYCYQFIKIVLLRCLLKPLHFIRHDWSELILHSGFIYYYVDQYLHREWRYNLYGWFCQTVWVEKIEIQIFNWIATEIEYG